MGLIGDNASGTGVRRGKCREVRLFLGKAAPGSVTLYAPEVKML
jgi:hypothetical protein